MPDGDIGPVVPPPATPAVPDEPVTLPRSRYYWLALPCLAEARPGLTSRRRRSCPAFEQIHQVCPKFVGARVRPESRVAACGWRHRVRVRDQDHRVPAGLVHVSGQIGPIRAWFWIMEDPRADVVTTPTQVLPPTVRSAALWLRPHAQAGLTIDRWLQRNGTSSIEARPASHPIRQGSAGRCTR